MTTDQQLPSTPTDASAATSNDLLSYDRSTSPSPTIINKINPFLGRDDPIQTTTTVNAPPTDVTEDTLGHHDSAIIQL